METDEYTEMRTNIQVRVSELCEHFNLSPVLVMLTDGRGCSYHQAWLLPAVLEFGRRMPQYHLNQICHEIAHHYCLEHHLYSSLVTNDTAHGKPFRSALALICRHVYGRNWRKHYHCPEYPAVVKAMRMPDQIPPFKCSHCDFTTTSRKDLGIHLHTTLHESPFAEQQPCQSSVIIRGGE